MSDGDANTCMLEPSGAAGSEMTGFPGPDEEGVSGDRRPLSMAWISDELLAETIDVWSENYGRPIGRDEAVEILMNVKRLAEVLITMRKEVGSQ